MRLPIELPASLPNLTARLTNVQTDAFPDQNYPDFRDYRYCRDYHGDNLDNRGDYYANYEDYEEGDL